MATLMRDARGQLGHADPLPLHLGGRPGPAHRSRPGRRAALSPSPSSATTAAGCPAGASGEDIPIEMRVAQLADVAEVHHRLYGVEGAVAMARSRRGGQLDPAVVDAFTADARGALPGSRRRPVGPGAVASPRTPRPGWTNPGSTTLLTAIGDFVDLKCPFTLGHSRNVAALAEAAAVQLGSRPASRPPYVGPGYLHDVGRIGVSNQVWSKPAELTEGRVGARADAPLPHRPGADPHPRTRARGRDRPRPP